MYNYDWVGYLSIFVLILSLIIGRTIFKRIDKTEVQPEKKQLLRKLPNNYCSL